MSDRVSESQRQAIITRAGGCCEYCQSQLKYSPDSFATEHIVPRSLGGQTSLDNLALACLGCNGYEYNKVEAVDPATEQFVPLYHPRKERWSDHFSWNEACTHIIGLSPTGRATIEVLHLNRQSLVNLRRVLFASGEHPPEPII
ncbi:MAG: HNH endonuclease signature motif containing protein [Candidatus Promineifilaceae bacterium]